MTKSREMCSSAGVAKQIFTEQTRVFSRANHNLACTIGDMTQFNLLLALRSLLTLQLKGDTSTTKPWPNIVRVNSPFQRGLLRNHRKKKTIAREIIKIIIIILKLQ
jgi:hypothetical protein